MAYMFNDDKSKNDVTEKPLIMTITKTISVSKMSAEEERTITQDIAAPTGYTTVSVTNAIVLDSDNNLYYGNIEVMQNSIMQNSISNKNDKIFAVFRLRCSGTPTGPEEEYLLKYNILFVRSEFASINIPNLADDN